MAAPSSRSRSLKRKQDEDEELERLQEQLRQVEGEIGTTMVEVATLTDQLEKATEDDSEENALLRAAFAASKKESQLRVKAESLRAQIARSHPSTTIPDNALYMTASIDKSPSAIVSKSDLFSSFKHKIRSAPPFAHPLSMELVSLVKPLLDAAQSGVPMVLPNVVLGRVIPPLSRDFTAAVKNICRFMHTLASSTESDAEPSGEAVMTSKIAALMDIAFDISHAEGAAESVQGPATRVAVMHQQPLFRHTLNCVTDVSVLRAVTSQDGVISFLEPVAISDAKQVDSEKARIATLAYSVGQASKMAKVAESRIGSMRKEGVFPIHVLFPFSKSHISLMLGVHTHLRVVYIDIMSGVNWELEHAIHVLFALLHVAVHAVPDVAAREPFLEYHPCVGARPLVLQNTPDVNDIVGQAHVFRVLPEAVEGNMPGGSARVHKYIVPMTDDDGQIGPHTKKVKELLGGLYLPGLVEKATTDHRGDILFWVVEYDFMPTDNDGKAIVGQFHMLFDALCTIHAGGFVHRDVRAANMLFLADGQARWIDFDFLAEEGTPYFRAYNGAIRERHKDATPGEKSLRSHDLFSFGAVMDLYQPVSKDNAGAWEAAANRMKAGECCRTENWDDCASGLGDDIELRRKVQMRKV